MTFWTDERTELLKKRWSEGLSAGQIKDELGGTTRNAVIGKARRLDLAPRPNPVANNGKPAGRPKGMKSKPGPIALLGGVGFANRNSPVPLPLPEEPQQDLSQFACLSIIDLNFLNDCKWPIGEDPAVVGRYLFCGAKSVGNGVNYCLVHWRRSMTEEGYRRAMAARKKAA